MIKLVETIKRLTLMRGNYSKNISKNEKKPKAS